MVNTSQQKIPRHDIITRIMRTPAAVCVVRGVLVCLPLGKKEKQAKYNCGNLKKVYAYTKEKLQG